MLITPRCKTYEFCSSGLISGWPVSFIPYRNSSLLTAKSRFLAALTSGSSLFNCSSLMHVACIFLVLLPELVLGQSVKPGFQDSVISRSDAEEYYAIYKPATQDSRKAILFFEPGGRAFLPVNKYQSLADKFGYTLICPYGSSNGAFEPTLKAAEAMVNELDELGFERSSVLTSGFSGGARAATAVQQLYDLGGVIAVAGARPPREDLYPTHGDEMRYTAIVGTRDMNMLEHEKFQEYLESQEINNAIIYYEAGHQWPPVEVYEQALNWQEQLPDPLIAYADSLQKTDSYLGWLQWDQWARSFENEKAQSKATQKVSSLAEETELAKIINQQNAARERQFNLRTKYESALEQLRLDLFQDKPSAFDQGWWSTEFRRLRKWSDADDIPLSQMADRLIDGLRGAIYVNTREAVEYNQFDNAVYLNSIMLLLYPKSVLFHFHQSIYWAGAGNKSKSSSYLKKATKLNPELLERMKLGPEYNVIRDNSDYAHLFR